MKSNMDQAVPSSETELVKYFASLGDNCEFGLLQRYLGAEPLGLFRFNYTNIDTLTNGIRKDFADLAIKEQVTIEFKNKEWFVRETLFKFAYHTYNSDETIDPEKLREEHSRYLRYMAREFLDDLEDGRKIFVRKGETGEDEEKIRALYQAMREKGPSTLLWVTSAEGEHPGGTVKWLDDGLMRGWVERFAPYDRAPDIDIRGWTKLLKNAWALKYRPSACNYPEADKVNLLLPDFGGWTGSHLATAEFVWDMPSSTHTGQVMKHTLKEEVVSGTDVFGCLIRPEKAGIYVISVQIFIPQDYVGTTVGVVLLGLATIGGHVDALTRKGQWQTIWASAELNLQNPVAFPRLIMSGSGGSIVFTSDWKLEAGRVPSGS